MKKDKSKVKKQDKTKYLTVNQKNSKDQILSNILMEGKVSVMIGQNKREIIIE